MADTELARYVEEVKQTDYTAYDMLQRTGVSFVDNSGKKDFTRDIKLWINKLIRESKRMFPIFKNKIKELFMGDENSIDGSSDIEFEIGSKISETVDPYSEAELDMPGLNVKSPAISRIIVKWIEELNATFLNSEERITSNKHGFKPTAGGFNVVRPRRKKELLASHIEAIIREKVVPYYNRRTQYMHVFLSEIMVLVMEGYEGR